MDEAPGEFPYTRGIQPTMYRGRPWTMRQYAGFGTAAESNARYRYLLAQGVTGLSVAFDLPTQMGYDSDHAMAAGEVGRVGVAIDSLDDMTVLLEGVPLDRVSTSMTINSTAIILLALYVAVARRQGVALDKISGTIQNDILKEYIARGTYIYPPQHSLRIVTDIFAWCERELPNWNTISISGYHIREAGSTAVQEVAFTLANAIAYVEAAREAGLDVDKLGQRLSFFFNAHNNFLEEVAKFRAARRLWARLMKERFGARSPRAMQLRFHTQTAGSTWLPSSRTTTSSVWPCRRWPPCSAAPSRCTATGRDEALALPTERLRVSRSGRSRSSRLSRGSRTQWIRLAGRGPSKSARRDRTGGARPDCRNRSAGRHLAAIESGWTSRQVQDAAYAAQQAVDRGDDVIVGVNRYQTDEPAAIALMRIDPDGEARQASSVQSVRASRDAAAWRASIDAVEAAARSGANLMPPVLDAVEARATLGEIADAMRRVFGEHRDRFS
jgi:methylmalonyl-CoA mutase N-terminal domain/subunit